MLFSEQMNEVHKYVCGKMLGTCPISYRKITFICSLWSLIIIVCVEPI